MTYEAVETSADEARPVEIYTFSRDFQRWRYTSADRDLVADGATYLPRALTRSPIESTQEKARNALTITGPRDLEVADLYRVSPPTLPVTLVLQQFHQGDGEIVTLWAGRIMSVEFAGIAARITLEPTYNSVQRAGLRRTFQRQCPHVLYGAACGVNREAVRVDGVVDSVLGLVATVPEAGGLPDGWFAGGYIEWEAAAGIPERRFITDHVGGALTLTATPTGLAGDVAVKLYPGCDHAIATCAAKFSNQANYGGFPYFTKKNPFGGDPIF